MTDTRRDEGGFYENATADYRADTRRDVAERLGPDAVEGWIVSDHWGHDMEWHRRKPEPDGIRGITRVRITPIGTPSDSP